MKFKLKFKLVVYILIILILGMFAYSIKLTYDLKDAVNNEKIAATKAANAAIAAEKSKDSIQVLNTQLEDVLKKLDVFEDSDREERQKQLNRKKFQLGFTVQARNKEYMDLIAYCIGSGFKLEYANQERRYIPNPVIYWYSEEGRVAAEDLKTDLKEKFPKFSDFEIKKGGSSKPPNTLTARLNFVN